MLSASRLAADSLRILPRKGISRILGRLADVGAPPAVMRHAVDAFVRVYGVDLSEADVPQGGFTTFDAFFTRRLRHGRRPVAVDPGAIVCPSDGRLTAQGPIDPGATFRIKGQLYTVAELLGDGDDAARFDGGAFALIYLAPPDYHRVHAPVSGRVRAVRHVDGTLYPVNDFGLAHVPKLFAKNERVVVFQDSPRHGEVATVLVGAIGVGRIGLSFTDLLTNSGHVAGTKEFAGEGPMLDRGDELGMFHLGSTVVLFFARGSDLTFTRPTEARVRMGEQLAAGKP